MGCSPASFQYTSWQLPFMSKSLHANLQLCCSSEDHEALQNTWYEL